MGSLWYNGFMRHGAPIHLLPFLITHYGYAALFLGTLLEGETIVALAGFAAYQGYLKLGYIIPIAITGAMIGDQAFFYFGRYKGKKFLDKRPSWKGKVDRVHQLSERYHGWIIFGSRFMYGFRAIIPIAFGASDTSAVRFFLLNLLGAIVWAPLFALGGYVFGNAIQHFLGNVRRFEGTIMFGIIIIVAVIQIILYFKRKNEPPPAS